MALKPHQFDALAYLAERGHRGLAVASIGERTAEALVRRSLAIRLAGDRLVVTPAGRERLAAIVLYRLGRVARAPRRPQEAPRAETGLDAWADAMNEQAAADDFREHQLWRWSR